jgi:hypothetical protein
MSSIHLPDRNGLPQCGVWPCPKKLRTNAAKPTCKHCMKILAGQRKPEDPDDTASRYGVRRNMYYVDGKPVYDIDPKVFE